MVETSTTPATKITVRTWTGLNLSRNLRVQDGAIVADLYAGASAQAQEFVGDTEGTPEKPVAPTMPTMAPAVAITQAEIMAILSQPTPAGVTILEHLDAELTKLAKAKLG